MDDVYRGRDVWPFNPPTLTHGFDGRFCFSFFIISVIVFNLVLLVVAFVIGL